MGVSSKKVSHATLVCLTIFVTMIAIITSSEAIFHNDLTEYNNLAGSFRNCRPIPVTIPIAIHNCVKFNLTTRACSGRCNSFTISNTEASNRLLGHETISYKSPTSKRITTIQSNMDHNDANFDENLQKLSQSDNNLYRPSADNVQIDDQDFARGSEQFYRKLATRMRHARPKIRLNPGMAGLIGSQITDVDEEDPKETINVSQCCSIDAYKWIHVSVICVEGYRKWSFKEPKSCSCDRCNYPK